jgi:hypothetical protein
MDDVPGVEDDFFSSLNAGASGFAGTAGATVGVFSLHGAARDEDDRAFVDDDRSKDKCNCKSEMRGFFAALRMASFSGDDTLFGRAKVLLRV